MSFAKIKSDIKEISKRKFEIIAQAEAQGRETSPKEETIIAELEGALAGLFAQLEKPLPTQTVIGPSGSVAQNRGGGGQGPFPSLGDFLVAVKNAGTPGGRVDQKLYDIRNAASGLNETVPSDGSFLVQKDFTDALLREAIATSQLAKQCMKFELTGNSNGLKINAFDETSRASTRFGGIVAYWGDEAGEYEKSKPKFRQMELSLKKLTGLCYVTDEMLEDSSVLESVLRMAFASEFGFQIDSGIYNGTGAGQLLGFMQSGCLVTIDAEVGQGSTIVAENVLSMVERTLGPTSNYAWYHSKSCLRQIYSLSLAIGTGGIPLFIQGGQLPNQPENRLLGLPLIEIEQAQVIGTTGDLVLADLSNGYALAEKGGIKTAVSLHVRFVYGEQVFRWTLRIDGQPTRASALTPAHGGASYTQSHFVALESR